MPYPDIVRINSSSILEAVLDWLGKNAPKPLKLLCLEGLPYAGKSTLLRLLPEECFSPLELDSFIDEEMTDHTGWASCIDIFRAKEKLDRLRENSKIPVIEGPALWELSTQLFPDLNRSELSRIYIKEMSKYGDGYHWEGLERTEWHNRYDNRTYFREIWKHHLSRPWEDADLIIERLPEE